MHLGAHVAGVDDQHAQVGPLVGENRWLRVLDAAFDAP